MYVAVHLQTLQMQRLKLCQFEIAVNIRGENPAVNLSSKHYLLKPTQNHVSKGM